MVDSTPILKLLFETDFARPADCRTLRMDAGGHLPAEDTLPRFAHILLSGAASSSLCMANGNRALVRMSFCGDLIEIYRLMGTTYDGSYVTMTVPGEVARIPFALVQRAFAADQTFRDAALASGTMHSLITQRLAACNLFHTIEERLARYLMTLSHHSGATVLPLTQEYLAEELGVQRSTLVIAAGELRRKGCVTFSRGRIHVIDPTRLAKAACECYAGMLSVRDGSPPIRPAPEPDSIPEPVVARTAA